MLETERCILKKIEKDDFEEIKKMYINECVRKYLGGIIQETDLEKKFSKLFEKSLNLNYWKILEKGTDNFLGMIYLDTHYNGINNEISYEFLPQFWGKGYGFETINCVIKYCFDELCLSELLAETQIKNTRSIKLLKKLNFVLTEIVERFGEEQGIFKLGKNIVEHKHEDVTGEFEIYRVLTRV